MKWNQDHVIGLHNWSHLHICHLPFLYILFQMCLQLPVLLIFQPRDQKTWIAFCQFFPCYQLSVWCQPLNPSLILFLFSPLLFIHRTHVSVLFQALWPSVVLTPTIKAGLTYRLILWHMLMRLDMDTFKMRASNSLSIRILKTLKGLKTSCDFSQWW